MSSRRIYEFRCQVCGLVHETLEYYETQFRPCPKCDGRADRAIVNPPRLDRLGMGAGRYASPDQIAYFDKVHRQQKAIEERCEREHGDYGPAPGAD